MKNFEKVLAEIAKKNGVTVEEVKRDIQEAIDATYINPNEHAKAMMRDGKPPGVEEFIFATVAKIKSEQ